MQVHRLPEGSDLSNGAVAVPSCVSEFVGFRIVLSIDVPLALCFEMGACFAFCLGLDLLQSTYPYSCGSWVSMSPKNMAPVHFPRGAGRDPGKCKFDA